LILVIMPMGKGTSLFLMAAVFSITILLSHKRRDSTNRLSLKQQDRYDLLTRIQVDKIVEKRTEELHKQNSRMVLEIKERKRVEISLRESEARWHFAVESSGDGIWDWDIERGEMYVSPHWLAMFSLSIDGTGITFDFWNKILTEEIYDQLVKQLDEVLAGKEKTFSLEHSVRKGDKQECWVLNRGMVIQRGGDGRPLRLIGTCTDISELKSIQKELKVLNSTLEEKITSAVSENRHKDHLLMQQSHFAAVGEMIGNVAHQWRQPLNALNLLLANLEDASQFCGADMQVLTPSFEHARRLIRSMSSTIDDFRNYYRPDRDIGIFSLRDVTQNTLRLLIDSLENAGIKVITDFGDIVVHGYANEFAQVVLNLLGNARQAIMRNEKNEKWIHLRIFSDAKNGLLSVSDSGGGVPEESLTRIFEPYYTTEEEGTGIGLYMCKVMIEKHMNGSIQVVNRHEGSEFIVSVPLHDQSEPVSRRLLYD